MPLFNINRSLFTQAYKKLPQITKNKKTVSYFTISLSLFTLSFFGFFAIRPTIITAVKLIKSVSDLKKIDLEYENKISGIIRAQTEYEQIRDSLPLINLAIPGNALFHKLAQAIENFAQVSELSINQLQIDNVPISKLTPSGKLQKYSFSLIGTGNYQAMSFFVQHLINWKRIITINSLEMTREGGTDNKNLRIALKATAYYEP